MEYLQCWKKERRGQRVAIDLCYRQQCRWLEFEAPAHRCKFEDAESKLVRRREKKIEREKRKQKGAT